MGQSGYLFLDGTADVPQVRAEREGVVAPSGRIVPQAVQNRSPGRIDPPQLGQLVRKPPVGGDPGSAGFRASPHPEQNASLVEASWPHDSHVTAPVIARPTS